MERGGDIDKMWSLLLSYNLIFYNLILLFFETIWYENEDRSYGIPVYKTK